MKLPEIPTDNLYKFMAIAGLSLFVLSVTYPASKALELELSIIDAETLIERIDVERDSMDIDLKRLKALKEVTEAEAASMRSALKELRLHSVESHKSTKVARLQFNFLVYYCVLALFGTWIGTWLARKGFRNWYLLTQIPADEALSNASAKRDPRMSLRTRLSSRFPS